MAEELNIYEIAELKKVQVATVKAAIKNGKLRVAREMPVGARRTLAMVTREDADAWNPRESGASLRKAAKLLGLDEETAEMLRAKFNASGQMNRIQVIE